MSEDYSIGEVAERFGLTVDALRYYERMEVLPRASRDGGGRRRYSANDLLLLDVLLHLRVTGTPLTGIAEYTRLVQQDPDGVPERLALLRGHRNVITEKIARLERSLGVIDGKIADYTDRLDSEPTHNWPTHG